MEFSTWIVFAIFAFITTITPGPAVLLAVSNSIAFGSYKAFYSSFGNSIGLFLVSCGVFLGLGAVLKASAVLFSFIKVVGAAYLIYLGIKHLMFKQSKLLEIDVYLINAVKNYQLLTQGIFVAITNPKAIIFFISLFPQFIIQNNHMTQQFIILSFTFSLIAFVSHSFYFVFLTRIKSFFSSDKRMKLFNRIIGGIFVIFGISLLRLRHV